MRTLLIDIQLNVCKVDYVELDRAGIPGNQSCQIHHFFFCTFTRIRWCMEIRCFQSDTAFCDHISGNRAVDTTGEQEHGTSVSSYRHSARPRNNL